MTHVVDVVVELIARAMLDETVSDCGLDDYIATNPLREICVGTDR